MFTELFTKHSLNIPGGTGTSGRRSVGYLQVPRQLKQKVANLVAFFGNYLLLNFSIEFTMVLVGTKFSTDTDLATAVLVLLVPGYLVPVASDQIQMLQKSIFSTIAVPVGEYTYYECIVLVFL